MRRFFNSRERTALYLAADGCCTRCGAELEPGWHADHVDPHSHGGETDVINGQALCPDCNLKKGAFVTKLGNEVHHERFVDFLTTPPLAGLGATVDTVHKLLVDDIEALDLFDQALRNPVGSNLAVSNRHEQRQSGTTKAAALRRLRKDAPELHAEVLAGRLSAHAAAVQAGFRPRTFTVRADSPESIAATLRRQLPAEQLSTLARLLTEA